MPPFSHQRLMTEEVTSDNHSAGSVRAKGGGHVSALIEEEKMAVSVLSTYYFLNLDGCCFSRRPIILCH